MSKDAQDIVLQAPNAVAVVEKDKAEGMVALKSDEKKELDNQVDDFLSVIMNSDVHSEDFQGKLKNVHDMASVQMSAAAEMSNEMLKRPLRAINEELGVGDGTSVGKSISELRSVVEGLDPSKRAGLLDPDKLFGIFPCPWCNKLKTYFQEYQSAETHIAAIVQALYNGQDVLRKDNAALEMEKLKVWDLMHALEKYAYVAKGIDEKLEVKIESVMAVDAEKARVIQEEILFYVRQKRMDILQNLAVNVQGYLSYDMIRKTNLELIKGVDRATTTTVAALKVAVTVAAALANQKLVLNQINALNSTTSDMISGTAKMMKQQTAEIHQKAASSTLEMEKLQGAFQDIYDTFNEVSDFKVNALASMKSTVDVLSVEVEKAKDFISKEKISIENTELDTIVL